MADLAREWCGRAGGRHGGEWGEGPTVLGHVDREGLYSRGCATVRPDPGRLLVTDTVKLEFAAEGSGSTLLVGGVVSINQEVDMEPVPANPFWSWVSAALTTRV